MKPLRGNYQLGWSRCNTRRTQNDQDLTPSRSETGLDASDNIHVSVERREKFFFLTSPLIGQLTRRRWLWLSKTPSELKTRKSRLHADNSLLEKLIEVSVQQRCNGVLSILFMTFHLTDDIVRGMEPGTLLDLIAVPILVVWLYGTLVLAERRSGYVITLLGSLLLLAVPVIHVKGKGVGVASGIANSSGGFFFVWTLIALGV